MFTQKNLHEMLAQYIVTAFWSSTDNSRDDGGDPLDANYGPADLAPESIAKMRVDCERFARDNYDTIAAVLGHKPRGARETIDWSSIGHDFWLNRNGHGAGFWDGDYPEPHGRALDAACKRFRECYLVVGDDGRIYCE